MATGKVNRKRLLARSLAVLFIATVLGLPGCMGAMAQLLYVIKGHKVPAEYSGLEEQKVAVVCVSDASAYGPDTLTDTISRVVGLKLQTNVKKIDVIPPRKIQQWIDEHGWNESDFLALGQGVGADKVLAVEVGGYSIHEGATIYKGRADVKLTIFDINREGRVDYIFGPEYYEFPEMGRPAIQTNDRRFEAFYLAKLTDHIARRFYPHDMLDTVADDAMSMR